MSYPGHQYTPLTKKEKVVYLTLGFLLAPIGVGFTLIATVIADYAWVEDNKRTMEAVKKARGHHDPFRPSTWPSYKSSHPPKSVV